jgi:hypothetical protein
MGKNLTFGGIINDVHRIAKTEKAGNIYLRRI